MHSKRIIIRWLLYLCSQHCQRVDCLCSVQVGPFIKLGPLRNVEGVAEIAGSLSGAGLVLILALALTIYGAASFQQDKSQVGLKTLSGAALPWLPTSFMKTLSVQV